MGRTRFLLGAAALTLMFSLTAFDARAITLPDTASPCSTASTDGCLKITNTDSTDYGATAFSAVTDSPFGTAILATGSYYGVQASSANYGIIGSAPNVGIDGSATSSTGIGVYGTSASGGDGLYGQASGSGKAVHGYNLDETGYAGYFEGEVLVTAQNYYAAITGDGGNNIGVMGVSAIGPAVLGQSTSSTGVEARTETGNAIMAQTYGLAQAAVVAENLSSSGGGYGVQATASGSGYAIYGSNTNSSGYAGYFDGKVFSTVSFTSSDARLKKDIAGLSYGLKDLTAVRPVTFKWKDQTRGDGRNIGFLAQDLQKVIPELVDQDAKSGMLSVNYVGLVPVLVKAIQEQQATIQRQQARIEGLEQRPMVSSMFSGGINVLVAIGGLAGLVLTVIRRRRGQAER